VLIIVLLYDSMSVYLDTLTLSILKLPNVSNEYGTASYEKQATGSKLRAFDNSHSSGSFLRRLPLLALLTAQWE
jgi:hypothetical protein